jgi:hypothetical protein
VYLEATFKKGKIHSSSRGKYLPFLRKNIMFLIMSIPVQKVNLKWVSMFVPFSRFLPVLVQGKEKFLVALYL